MKGHTPQPLMMMITVTRGHFAPAGRRDAWDTQWGRLLLAPDHGGPRTEGPPCRLRRAGGSDVHSTVSHPPAYLLV